MPFTRTLLIPAPRAKVWELVSDTDRVDREIGLPPVQFEFLPRRVGGSELAGTVRFAGLRIRYREEPYEWERPDFFAVRRVFESGPVREFQTRFTFMEEAGGTRVVCVTHFLPRSPLLAPLTNAVAQKFMTDLHGAWRTFAAYLAGQIETPYPKHSRQFPAIAERLEQSVRALSGLSAKPELARRLGDYLAAAPPEDVTQLRPFALADAWKEPRNALLELCLLAATRQVGLLDLRWRLLCPMCRGSSPENVFGRLNAVTAQVHCPSCNIAFDSEFDRSVEVCFAVAKRVRPVEERLYCRGGPGMSPHVAAQWVLAPNETRAMQWKAPAGRYVLASPQSVGSLTLHLGEGVAEFQGELAPCEGGFDLRMSAENLAVGAEGSLTNRSAEPVVLRLESSETDAPVATAALVSSMQAFRDNFSSEALAPGTELAVRQICVLFSDLKGSTALYRERGDAPSYRIVRDHFAAMRRIVQNHEGAVVKTIGDSVMATFSDAANGVAAALSIQAAAQGGAERLTVKLGLHAGSAIAVNANDLLDYFGQTVNLASRLQGESVGDDLIIAAELLEDARVAQLLAERRCRLEPFTHTIRGFDAPLKMVRIRLQGGESAET